MRTISPFKVTGWESTPYEEEAPGPKLFRVRVRKTFDGDLRGESQGELLMCVADGANPSAGAGYVISERVVGELGGRSGSFVLQHWGVSGAGKDPSTAGYIVPGSGTDELKGLAGKMEIAVDASGAHAITLDYELA